jgi:group I intron endonuclease
MEPLSGVYAIICKIIGTIYIGSSINIGNRLVDHLVTNNTNEHLKNSINRYGLENFVFVVVELLVVVVAVVALAPPSPRFFFKLRT